MADYEKLIAQIRAIDLRNPDCLLKAEALLTEAADAIEVLLTERDAAVKDMTDLGNATGDGCHLCKKLPCAPKGCTGFEWRGPRSSSDKFEPAFCPNCGHPRNERAWEQVEQSVAECHSHDAVREAVRAISKLDSQSTVGQSTYVIEECSELIKELMRERRGKGSDEAIISEACDVLNTIFILLVHYGVSEDLVREKILSKCNRALERYDKNGEV